MSRKKRTVYTLPEEETDWVPRTHLGQTLRSIRKKTLAKGMSLLTEEEVLDQLRNRRSCGPPQACREGNGGSDV